MSSSQPTPNTVLVFGGNGKTGRAVTTALLAQTTKFIVYSAIRNPDQSPTIESLGATPVICDLATASTEEIVSIIQEVKASFIVWCAGASPPNGDPDLIDNKAAIRSFDAAEAAALIKRYIHVSALDVRDRENKETPPWYSEQDTAGSDRLWKVLDVYMAAKLKSDRNLVLRKDLKWTIIRPGRLVEDAPVGKADCGRVHFGRPVSRGDIANVVVECIENDGTEGLAFDVVGGDTDVREAVAKAVKNNEDCFRGFY